MGTKVFVAGSSGATGRLVTELLLERGAEVRSVVRSPGRIPDHILRHPKAEFIEGSLLDLSISELSDMIRDFHAIVSCLGHNITLKGIYGEPRKLVRDATEKLCDAVRSNNPESPVRFILMSTTGYRNKQLKERLSLRGKLVIQLLRLLLPPHSDNEQAAEYLIQTIGQNVPHLEWVAVRPDNLLDHEEVTDYNIHPSPLYSSVFKGGSTSRINVANLMTRLVLEPALWAKWKYQLPVIYNRS